MVVTARGRAAHVIVGGTATQRGDGEYGHQDWTKLHGFTPCKYINACSIRAGY